MKKIYSVFGFYLIVALLYPGNPAPSAIPERVLVRW